MNKTFKDDLFIGLDLGTSGVRALACGTHGDFAARAECPYQHDPTCRNPGFHEQQPWIWQLAIQQTLRQLTHKLGSSISRIRALAVDGTSGTLVPVDCDGKPLRPAIMYNDARATSEALELNIKAGNWCIERGYQIEASFAAAKIRWLRLNEPETFEKTRYFLHHADFAVAFLTGQLGITDFSNALKTGYDLQEDEWPTWLTAEAGVAERLPDVVAPGEVVGQLRDLVATECGLPAGLTIVAGASDGTAGFFASGATEIGDDNTSLGTTLIFKRLSLSSACGTQGQVYAHKLPGGRWLPGAASNTGAAWIQERYPDAKVSQWDDRARALLPSSYLAYPLVGRGERFPFAAADAVGFCIPASDDQLEQYAAGLQGTALVERLGYEVLNGVTEGGNSAIFSTGAASRSNSWLQLRADVNGRPVCRPAHPDAAFGCAVLAALHRGFANVWEAGAAMVRIDHSFEPNPERRGAYDELYCTEPSRAC